MNLLVSKILDHEISVYSDAIEAARPRQDLPGRRPRPRRAQPVGAAPARSSACSARTAPASPPPSASSRRSRGRRAAAARVAGHDVSGAPARCAARSACVAQRRASTARRPAARTSSCRASSRACGGRDCDRRADELLERVRPRGRRRPARQRLLAAACSAGSTSRWALVHRPRSSSSTSRRPASTPRSARGMWAEIARLARDEGLTVLLTTHYLDEADRLAVRLAIVDRGRVVAEGTPDELKAELRGRRRPRRARPTRRNGSGARRARPRRPALRELVVEGRTLRARADDGARAVPAVLGALEAHGDRRRVRDRRAALARRRLPAPRRARFEGGSSDDHDARHTGIHWRCRRDLRALCASRGSSPSRSCSR